MALLETSTSATSLHLVFPFHSLTLSLWPHHAGFGRYHPTQEETGSTLSRLHCGLFTFSCLIVRTQAKEQ